MIPLSFSSERCAGNEIRTARQQLPVSDCFQTRVPTNADEVAESPCLAGSKRIASVRRQRVTQRRSNLDGSDFPRGVIPTCCAIPMRVRAQSAQTDVQEGVRESADAIPVRIGAAFCDLRTAHRCEDRRRPGLNSGCQSASINSSRLIRPGDS